MKYRRPGSQHDTLRGAVWLARFALHVKFNVIGELSNIPPRTLRRYVHLSGCQASHEFNLFFGLPGKAQLESYDRTLLKKTKPRAPKMDAHNFRKALARAPVSSQTLYRQAMQTASTKLMSRLRLVPSTRVARPAAMTDDATS
jgi:hypothetical protein